MRLRSRLALAFALLAVAPLALVVPFALSELRGRLSAELQARMDAAVETTHTVLLQRSSETRQKVEELADSQDLEEVAKAIHLETSATLKTAAEALMKSRGLGVLSLFDAEGRTLSSGHLPARMGDPDPDLFSAIRVKSDATPMLVELRDERGLKRAPALVAADSMAYEYGHVRLWAVGGMLLDQSFADHLSVLTGAQVDILSSDASALHTAGLAPGDVLERRLDLSPHLQIRLSLSREPQRDVERGILRAFATAVAIGLSLAVLLGIWVAGRITRPVEALTVAARDIASGQLSQNVQERAGGEIGELVLAFNKMSADLRSTTARLLSAERIAAWQEVAKRLAHEIKNPLTPIRMSLETLLAAKRAHAPQFDPLFQESAPVMIEEVDRLRRIVDEFSQFARLPKPQLKRLDVSECVEHALSLYTPTSQIQLTSDLASDLKVDADRDQLTQVLLNLVKNAYEATPAGGQIWIRTRREGELAVLEVEDTGPGVSPEHAAKLFEPYFTTKASGTGLGLAIASRICQEHGGQLEVVQEPGKGARFRVALPSVMRSKHT